MRINKLECLDLFSGIGGFSYAAEKAGFKTIGFSENDTFCSAVLKKHWPDVPNYGDIKKLEFTQHVHLITGGFPCQPFSIAGKQKGKTDDRYLWGEFYRIIREAKPCWVLAENVTGIISLALDDILADLEKEGYETTTLVLPACAANAPHRRDRVWIIANRPSERCNYCKNNRKRRYLQIDEKRYIEALQQEWKKFKPITWASYSAKDWFGLNTRTSRRNDGLSQGLDRIKALGNSIVPQIAFVILSFIKVKEQADGLEESR